MPGMGIFILSDYCCAGALFVSVNTVFAISGDSFTIQRPVQKWPLASAAYFGCAMAHCIGGIMSKAVLAGFVVFFGAYHIYSQSQPLELKEGPEALRHGATLVYFGANDCPACRSFTRRYMSGVINQTDRMNVRFVVREEHRLYDIGKPGMFSDFEPVYKAARKRMSGGVPAFVYIKDGKIVDTAVGNWQPVLRTAQKDAASN
jgi:predicted bacteriocin transport accessory protein